MAFKVCIISCGMITNAAHIPAYRQFPEDYDIVAVSDINETAARETAERYGIPHYYTDAEKMLTEEKPDVVSVCVPNAFHKEYTMMALRHGANVLCEKPLAFRHSDAVEMFELAKEKGKVLMACQSMRFTPDRLAAKKFIEAGGMDEIYYGELSRIRRRGIPYWGTFHMKKISGGGAFVDIGIKQNGLIHASQMGVKGMADPSKVLKLHQKIKVTVVSVDLDRGRIGLRLMK